MLRDLLLNEEGDNAELYSREERGELLWRVFEHLCLGGPCCQFEVRRGLPAPGCPGACWLAQTRLAGAEEAARACPALTRRFIAVLPAQLGSPPPPAPQDQLEAYLEVAKRLYKEMLRWGGGWKAGAGAALACKRSGLTLAACWPPACRAVLGTRAAAASRQAWRANAPAALRSVQRGAGGALEVASVVYKVSGVQSSAGGGLFPAHSRSSFCYVAVDPLRRVARLWYHACLPFW
jgi:hypothetical protein